MPAGAKRITISELSDSTCVSEADAAVRGDNALTSSGDPMVFIRQLEVTMRTGRSFLQC